MKKTEFLDIIDENDNVTGKGTRKSVHDKRQIHRGVHVFIINHNGHILIQKRSLKKDDRPGFFDASCGAQVSSGESYEQAAEREVKEELGVNSGELVRIGKYKSFSERQREIRVLFIAKSDGPFKIDKREVEEVKFLTMDTIQKLIACKSSEFTEGFKLSFKLYQDYTKQTV